MASEDLSIKGCLVSYGFPAIILLILLIFLKKAFKPIRNKFFAGFMASRTDNFNIVTNSYKEVLFKTLNGMESANKQLKNEGQLRILEVGAGAGANFKYYPKNSRLVVVEPNPYFPDYFHKNHSEFKHVTLEKFCEAYGEDMKAIADNSVDAVVSTIVLCSVQDVRKVLKEVKRVLVPGGKFLYLEHVHDKKGTWLHLVQTVLSITGTWPFIFDGCMLNRNIDKMVSRAGFSKVDQKRIMLDVPTISICAFVRSHVMGTATK